MEPNKMGNLYDLQRIQRATPPGSSNPESRSSHVSAPPIRRNSAEFPAFPFPPSCLDAFVPRCLARLTSHISHLVSHPDPHGPAWTRKFRFFFFGGSPLCP